MVENYVEELINKLGEECNEVGQIVCKINNWGIDGFNPVTNETNSDLLHQEVGDVLTMIDLLITEGVLDEMKLQNAKIKKRVKFRQWAKFKPKPIEILE